MQSNAMKPPTPQPSFLLGARTSFPVAGSSFIPNTSLLLNQLGNISNLNILGLQQQLCTLTSPQQQTLVAGLSSIPPDLTGHAKRALDHADAAQNPSQPKAQRSSHASSSESEVVQQLIKEREELSAALKASNEEVVRLREVVAQIMEGEQRPKSEDDTDDSSHGQRRYWNEDEHQRFLEGLEKYGPKSVKAIAEYVGTRTATQVRTHAQKYYQKLARMRKAENKASSDDMSGMSTEAGESSAEQSSDTKEKESSQTPEED